MPESANRVVTITVAAERCMLPVTAIRRYIRCGLIAEPLSSDDMLLLRRIRRLNQLGINMPASK